MQLQYLMAMLAIGGTSFAAPAAEKGGCNEAAKVICVRGSDFSNYSLKPNPAIYKALPSGMVGAAEAVVKKIGHGAHYEALPYAAISPNAGGNYAKSVEQGIKHLHNAVEDYSKKCPKGKIYLIGYSQGAQVVSGFLGGATPGFGNAKPYAHPDKITAAVNFADPGRVPGDHHIDKGTADKNKAGGTVHNNAAQYKHLAKQYGGKYRGYCQSGDAYCDSGYGSASGGGTIHGNEPETYQHLATGWLLEHTPH